MNTPPSVVLLNVVVSPAQIVFVPVNGLTTGEALLVMMISSVDGVQLLLLIVQRRVAELPEDNPVIVVVAEVGDVIVAVPLMRDHKPVPTVGLFAAMVNDPLLH